VKIALYFGYGNGGHFLRGIPTGRDSIDPQRDVAGFPWSAGNLDTGLLDNRGVDDLPDGTVYWTCGGTPELWHAFFWWDRSGDKRPGSNSGFYVRGFGIDEREAAFAFACERWASVVKRQLHPLTLEKR
jgi:hypothetical protein